MERSGWFVFASAMSLLATAFLANGFLVVQGIADDFEDQSRAEPPRQAWYQSFGASLIYAGVALAAIGVWPMAYGWAKVRSKTLVLRRRPVAGEQVGDEDAPLMPPGFFGPAARTRRVGAMPLVGFTFMGVAFLAGASAILFFGTATFDQTLRMEGRGLRTAVLWGQLVKFVALPLAVAAAATVAIAWGRWFPLGELEVVEPQKTSVPRVATGYRFDRQG